jgi:type I restriction enzyme M protein
VHKLYYKEMLRADWAEVFYGQPDSYTFFLKFGLELLAPDGRLGFITPNTYLMGTNTATLRGQLLTHGRIEQIVDLPQGIWPDADVDCVLLFLARETDAEKRKAQLVRINILGLRETLDKLAEHAWSETLTQPQSRWLADPKNEMNIRYDELLQRIEDACRIPTNGGTKVLRLGDVTESSPGIDPYKTSKDGRVNLYINPRRIIPTHETDWKPLLDKTGFVGRYELRWGNEQHLYKIWRLARTST